MPKETHHSAEEIRLGVAMGTLAFNCGLENAAKGLMHSSNIPYGNNSARAFEELTKKRKARVLYKTQDEVEQRRKDQRYSKRRKLNAFHREEGPMYASGEFHAEDLPPDSCKSCGGTDHRRKTSKKCPHYKM